MFGRKKQLEERQQVISKLEKQFLKDKKKGEKEFERSFSERKFKKPGAVAVLYLTITDHAEPVIVRSYGGMFEYRGKTYHERRDCKYTYGKKRIPLMILPEWSLVPLGTKEWEDKEMRTKFAELQDHAINGIRRAERVRMGESLGSKLQGKTLIAIAVLAIIGIAIMSQLIGG